MRLLFRLLAAGTMLVACFGSLPSEAQPYPSRPIRIVAPFPAGGLVDVLARAVGEELAKSAGTADHRREQAGRGRQHRCRRRRQGGSGWLHAA